MSSSPQRQKEDIISDLNLVVIAGRLAGAPEIRVFDSGATLVRYLVTTRTGPNHAHVLDDSDDEYAGCCLTCGASEDDIANEPRRRIDVVPAVMWDASEEDADFERGDRIWIAGSIQRRFWSDDHSRRSRIEVVAHHVQKNIDQKQLEELTGEERHNRDERARYAAMSPYGQDDE